MRLGTWLPNALPYGLDRRTFLDWARVADEAGFHRLVTLDRPNYDMWDPLASLAAAAAVTQHVRLATTTLQLPNRNEVLVAKQAAVIDQLSAGRLTLGVSLGGRSDDYEVFGATTEHRVTRFRAQVGRIREVWATARAGSAAHGEPGPPPVQEPGPPIWLGAMTEKGQRRAVELADGFVFGGIARPPAIAAAIEDMRGWAQERGRDGFSFAALAYVAIGGERELAEAVGHHRRYYPTLPLPPEQAIHHGPVEQIAEVAAAYAEAGLDELIVMPEVRDLRQLELLAEHVLPAYR